MLKPATVADFLGQPHTSPASHKRRSLQKYATTALKAAAGFWFLVAVIGQLVFASYVAIFYGRAAVQGDFQAWNKTMTHGYIAGQTIGNFAVAMHLLLAVIIIVGGALQLIPQIRNRAPSFHRWNGRIYMLTALTLPIGGLYMVWVRGGAGDFPQHVAISVNAVLIMLCATMALRFAMARKFAVHRRWALRLFVVASGVWFFRIGVRFWIFVNHGPAGFDPNTFTGPFLTFWSFGQYLMPLAVLELYLRTRDRGGAPGRLAMATGLLILTVAMGVGIFLTTRRAWLPRIF